LPINQSIYMKYFVTGIGTDIGKTIASAILVEALKADYWKPIQSGDLDYSDSHKVRELVSNTTTKFHPESYRLKTPVSPHAAAKKDNIIISLKNIHIPKTSNNLIIEGAGGLLVPINDKESIIDLIQSLNAKVILLSQHYLGSINHTLLSIEALQQRKIPIEGILFNGDEEYETEKIILSKTALKNMGRIPILNSINKATIKNVAQQFNFLKK